MKTIPTIELILIVGMVLYIDNEFYVIQILESFYVEIIIFPIIFGGQIPPILFTQMDYFTVTFFTFLNVAVRLFSVVRPLRYFTHMTPDRKNSSGFILSVPAVFQIFNKFYISFRRNKAGLMVY